jgi:hypothetical protein
MQRVRQFILICCLIPLLASTAAAQVSISSSDGDGRMRWMHSDGNDSYEVDAVGTVVFASDDSGIESISSGGYLTIKVEENGRRVALDVRPGSGGDLTYDYRVNGRRVDYDASARREIGKLLLMVIRESGINADVRVARILKKDGVKGVFDEIAEIRSGSSVGRYLTELVAQADMNTRELTHAADVAEHRIGSSGSLARFLRTSAPVFIADEGTYDGYFSALESISSSGDKTRTLMAVVEAEPGREGFVRTLRTAQGISSSGDKTRLLLSTLGHFPSDAVVRDLYFKTVGTISSSGDRSRLLRALLTEYEIDEQTAAMAFESAAGISSSGDKSRVLIQAAPYYTDTDAQRDQFFRAVNTISSSGDHARVLIALLDGGRLSDATLIEVLNSARGISSSGDASRVLQHAAPKVDSDAAVDAFLKAADSISSASDRGRALTALMDR